MVPPTVAKLANGYNLFHHGYKFLQSLAIFVTALCTTYTPLVSFSHSNKYSPKINSYNRIFFVWEASDYYVCGMTSIITDINECALELDQCEQVCVNLNGSYTCECSDGYQTVTGRYYACEGVLYSIIYMFCMAFISFNLIQISMNVVQNLIGVSKSVRTLSDHLPAVVYLDIQRQAIN